MLFNCDCLKRLPLIEPNFFDCLITDPPYKQKTGKGRFDDKGNVIKDPQKNKWKSNQNLILSGNFIKNIPDFSEWLPECYRVLKDGTHAYIFVDGAHLSKLQTEAEKAGFKYQNLLVWRKNNKTPNNFYMKQAEFILMLRKGKARYVNNRGISTVLEIPNVKKKIHPTQKPYDLIKILVEQSTKRGEVVLDPFAGSGIICKVCEDLHRGCYAMEIEKEYVKNGNNL